MGEVAGREALSIPFENGDQAHFKALDAVLSAAEQHHRTESQTGCQELPGCSNRPTCSLSTFGKRKLPSAFSQAASRPTPWPVLDFCQHGKMVYATFGGEVEFYCKKLLELGVQAVGFDIEWRATFRPGEAQRRTALVQFCYRNQTGTLTCLLLQVAQTGMTPSLKELLISSAVCKAGLGIEGDAHKILRDFGVRMEGVYNLAVEAGYRMKLAGANSLEGLTAALLRHRLPKDGGQRLSNWETRPLSLEQQAYAATDAFASLRVYEELQALPLLPIEGQQRMRFLPTAPPALEASSLSSQAPPSSQGLLDSQSADLTEVQQEQWWVAAMPELGHLAHAPTTIHQMVHHQKMTIAEVAKQRGVKEDTVLSYLGHAIIAGHGFAWPVVQLPLNALPYIARLAQQILAAPPILLDKPAAAPKQGRKVPKSMKKPAPCEDLAARLLKHGTSLGNLKAQLGDGLSIGVVSLGLAYLGRVGLKKYLASLQPALESVSQEPISVKPEPAESQIQKKDSTEALNSVPMAEIGA